MSNGIQKLTAEELEGWVVPKIALGRYITCGAGYGQAIDAIINLLRHGLLRSGARSYASAAMDDIPGGVVEIEASRWASLGGSHVSDLWTTGQVTLTVERRWDTVDIIFFGVRFEPVALARNLQDLGEKAAASTVLVFEGGSTAIDSEALLETPKTPAEDAIEAAKKELPPLLLDEWAALFRKAYHTGPEALATESVAGMFPRHRVSRPRLRAALKKVGTLPRGRRTEKDDD